MTGAAPHLGRLHDLPVCFPGRQCVDQSPLGADLIGVALVLTPASAAIAAACFAVLGASAVLLGAGVRLQRRGSGVRPWLVVLIWALLVAGSVIVTVLNGWFDAITVIYGTAFGQPNAPAPAFLTGSWPSVRFAGSAMVALAVIALVAMLHTAATQRARRIDG